MAEERIPALESPAMTDDDSDWLQSPQFASLLRAYRDAPAHDPPRMRQAYDHLVVAIRQHLHQIGQLTTDGD
jgi:hypothetical protein